ncbi:MAG: type I 3-dehydroquinate dehydratase [Clostridia bacterium]|nr:type I 3-dehydroquinate dehydratase [Clostridia bacterium]
MMKPSFVNIQRPLLTVMVNQTTLQADKAIIARALQGGAEAFCIQVEHLRPEDRTLEKLKELFAECRNRPIYITAYREGLDDEGCVELMLRALDAGATLIDVMGDLYHPEPTQMTFDEEAVAKQKALIDLIHARGGEVLMSAHFRDYIDTETVMKFALAQKERGVDIVKMVSFAHNEEQMMANINLAQRMKHELDCPYLFLNSGACGRLLRQLGPAFGVCMYLCLENYTESSLQPLLRTARDIRDAMGL